MRYLFLLLTSFCCTVLLAQQQPVEVFARFKTLGFVFIEDFGTWSGSVGTQLRLGGHFGLVVDVVHFRWYREQEIYTDPGNTHDYYEVTQTDARNYLATELRYYPIHTSKLTPFAPYLNMYSKYGKRKLRSDTEYTVEPGLPRTINSDLFDWGASVGTEIGTTMGVDVNLGFCYRWENRFQDIYAGPGLPITYTENDPHNRFLFNIRVSLFWNFMAQKF